MGNIKIYRKIVYLKKKKDYGKASDADMRTFKNMLDNSSIDENQLNEIIQKNGYGKVSISKLYSKYKFFQILALLIIFIISYILIQKEKEE